MQNDMYDTKRLSSGVYLVAGIPEQDVYVTGSLFYVLQQCREHWGDSFELRYLVEIDGDIVWQRVDVGSHQHYHGEQVRQVLSWFWELECPLSKPGFQRFSLLTGVPEEMFRHTLRPADQSGFRPLSPQVMLLLKYRIARLNQTSS